MSDPVPAALEALRAAGFTAVDVPVLLPMEDFVRISGEEFRRRIFVTTDASGTDWCLRPEFTIPVCRRMLAGAPEGGRWSYSGRIFRNGRGAGESHEVWQIGAEIIGRQDVAAADVETLTLALDACRRFGLSEPAVTIGDVALFSALLEALEVPPAWMRRLGALFGDPARVIETLDHMAERQHGYSGFSGHGEIVGALSRFPADRVGALFADILAIAGVQTVGGRSTAEIAERVVEQAMLAAEELIPEAHARAIRDLLAIETPLAEAGAALAALSVRVGRPARFEAAVAAFDRRAAALAAAGAGRAVFSATFGRKLGYYDGFVFDVHDPERPAVGQVAGGGRYDGLLAGFGAAEGTRAVGFSVWTERFRDVTR
ncbi:ATP phosphoribosyltransferase regulatory subunit [Oharaeibacter diazotrophicus]|uniref:ATP phosphoribosyltransferase regulatory subunit n=3 Tax=Oharaeibacter diazotrophicus TaxID=1920512 RepID=A0A4R6RBQ6_9HYPH|nr:ATP phosphoribosyltransferase regulatory subunit [Oharaeibacter diazotrophicus]TDP83474.1 ATP phosphoribosyltransferase regulatory subunit [Oharaeibacter diazotrophicus]BBE72307.1 ATP phosphoribosyltransferase regulatory subunit [Pleomorphomonas sp. SM30]GLS79077.1 ATP phosphoribosyltransferase regulatory subunit [Oharaeibacter diazotrophicus]